MPTRPTDGKTLMTNPAARNDSQIDHASSAAICDEIGDRLRLTLARKPHRLPQRMMKLVERMAADKPVTQRLPSKSEVAS
jgi:hypothetical protein